jgi:hypothetical protein
MGRADLIGNGKKQLIPAWQPAGTGQKAAAMVARQTREGQGVRTSTCSRSPRPGALLHARAQAGGTRPGQFQQTRQCAAQETHALIIRNTTWKKPPPLTKNRRRGGCRQTVRSLLRTDGHGSAVQGVAGHASGRPAGSRDKLFMFLSGWMGGPDLFVEKFGHPRLRGRHMPFAIGIRSGTSGSPAWLAMEDVGLSENLRKKLLSNFFHTADFMRNKEG